jgi:hypothetical protein
MEMLVQELNIEEEDEVSGGMCNCLCSYQGNEYYLGKRGNEINCQMDCTGRGMGYIGCN